MLQELHLDGKRRQRNGGFSKPDTHELAFYRLNALRYVADLPLNY